MPDLYLFSASSSSSNVLPFSASAATSASYFSLSAFFAARAFANASFRRALRSSALSFGFVALAGFSFAASRRVLLASSFSSAS